MPIDTQNNKIYVKHYGDFVSHFRTEHNFYMNQTAAVKLGVIADEQSLNLLDITFTLKCDLCGKKFAKTKK